MLDRVDVEGHNILMQSFLGLRCACSYDNSYANTNLIVFPLRVHTRC